MDIQRWIKARGTPGTKEHLARRIAARSSDYATAEEVRQLFVLETLVKCNGKHEATAVALKIHRHTIQRALRALGLTSEQVKVLAKQLNK